MKFRDFLLCQQPRFELKATSAAALVAMLLGAASSAYAQCNSCESAAPSSTQPASAGQLSSNAQGGRLQASENLLLTLPKPLQSERGRFAVMLGSEDVTANFRWVSETQLEGVFAAMPMPAGKHLVKLYAINEAEQWQEIGATWIEVAQNLAQTALGNATNSVAAPAHSTGEINTNNTQKEPENAQNQPPAGSQAQQDAPAAKNWKPSLIIGLKSQPVEAHSALAQAPAREHFADVTLQASLQTEHGDEKNSLKTQWNLVGSSYRNEALNFGGQGVDAPKVDLANFLIESKLTGSAGATSLAAGHIQAGQNPLLANGIANRGMSIAHQFSPRLDMGLAVQSGSPFVGGSHLLPITNSEHRMQTFMLGAELLERPGALRAEITSFSGTVKPTQSLGWATLQDAEQSQGTGLRFKSANVAGDLRADLAYARSRYTPKGDSSAGIAPGPATSGHAWALEVAYDAIKNKEIAKDWPLNLSLTAKHEFAANGYKSLGAGQAGNYESDSVNANLAIGAINGQLQWSQRADNVDQDPAFLKNRNAAANASLNIPLGQLIQKEQPPLWAPQLALTLGRNHTNADARFIPSGQSLANLPNVIASTQGANLNWTIKKLTLGYQLNRSLQDNQQSGMEQMDMRERGHNLTAAYPFTEKLNLSGAAGRRTSTALDTGIQRFGQTAQATLAWQFGDRYNLNANASTSHDHDSLLTSNSKSLQAQLQLVKQFDSLAWGLKPGLKIPGQWTLSYAMNMNQALSSGGLQSQRNHTVNFALNVTAF